MLLYWVPVKICPAMQTGCVIECVELDSMSRGRLQTGVQKLEPEPGRHGMQDAYELEESGAGLMAQRVPYHWRMHARSLGRGAFHGLKVNAAALVRSVARRAPGNWLAHGSARHARERMSDRAGG